MKSYVLLLSLMLTACASQKPAPSESHAPSFVQIQHSLHYVDLADFPKSMLPPPPAVDSLIDQADVMELGTREKGRTAQQCTDAMKQMNAQVQDFFPNYPFASVPAADHLFANVGGDVHEVVEKFKDTYKRPRPFTRKDHPFKACYEEKRSTSYPSGHAAVSEVYARVLGELEPARKEEFLKDAQQAALHRVIAGVHHPSDVKAGTRLGDAIFEKMKESPAFQRDLAAVRSSR